MKIIENMSNDYWAKVRDEYGGFPKDILSRIEKRPAEVLEYPDATEEMQCLAVHLSPKLIDNMFLNGDYIPSEKVQLTAIKSSPTVFGRIVNDLTSLNLSPSQTVQLEAVSRNGHGIQYIRDPSEEVQLAAVSQNGYTIQWITNPSKKIQLAAVYKQPRALKEIIRPRNGNICIPCEEVQLSAVRADGATIRYLLDNDIVPSRTVQMTAVMSKPEVIIDLPNPSRLLQLTAVKADPTTIYDIKNPDPLVIEYVKTKTHIVYPFSLTEVIFPVPKNLDSKITPEIYRNLIMRFRRDPAVLREFFDKGIIPEENIQLDAVERDGNLIKLLLKKGITPSSRVQLAAARNASIIQSLLQYNIIPSEEVQILSASLLGSYCLQALHQNNITPSMKVFEAAIKQDGRNIKFFSKFHLANPSIHLQILAVSQCGEALRDIIQLNLGKIDHHVLEVALAQDGSVIRFIPNPSKDLQAIAVKNVSNAISYIPNPDEDIQLESVRADGWALEYIMLKGIAPSNAVLCTAVQRNPSVISIINNPSRIVQLTAVKNNPKAIKYIKNPDPLVKEYIQRLK